MTPRQMSSTKFRLEHAPIIEAVVDIDCALPPDLDIASLENLAKERFADGYPKARKQVLHEASITRPPEGPPEVSGRVALQALQFLSEDEKQIVQVRASGFSFNRLEPYASFDDYLPEIHVRWAQFLELVKPVHIRRIVLRGINRIVLPLDPEGRVKLEEHLALSPRLPDETGLVFDGFLHQHQATDRRTSNRVTIVLASEAGTPEGLPVILDIIAFRSARPDLGDWPGIEEIIRSLRDLRNQVFKNSLTPTCLSRYLQRP